jgi:hypothetical protein
MSKKRQRCAVVNLENNFSILAKFTDVSLNKTTVHTKHNYRYEPKHDKCFDKTINEVALLVCFLFLSLCLNVLVLCTFANTFLVLFAKFTRLPDFS